MVVKILVQWDEGDEEQIEEVIKFRNKLIEFIRTKGLYTGFSTVNIPPKTFGILTKLGRQVSDDVPHTDVPHGDVPYFWRPPSFSIPIFEAEACGEPTIQSYTEKELTRDLFKDWPDPGGRVGVWVNNEFNAWRGMYEPRIRDLQELVKAKLHTPFVVTGLDYRGPYKKLWLRTKIDGKEHNLTAIPSKNFGELMSKATQFDNLIEEFGESIPWLINTLEDEVDERNEDNKKLRTALKEKEEMLKNLKVYVSDRDWCKLPSKCPECGGKMEVWFDGTYSCKNGHVMAYSGDGGIFWWMPESKVLEQLDNLKADLIQWSRGNDPPENETQMELWCSMNRIIGKYFGTEWMIP